MNQAKTVIITGAAMGIGAATAAHFSELGWEVIQLDLRRPEDAKWDAPLLNRSLYFQVDVSDEIQVKKTFDEIGERFEKVDALVNNAGIQTYGTVETATLEDFHKTLNVNLLGPFLCSRAALPLLRKSDHPSIVNVSSVQALVTEPNVAAYTSSKAGLIGLTRSMAVDLAPEIRVNAVCPGAVNTPMVSMDLEAHPHPEELIKQMNSYHLLNRIAQPEEVARMIYFLASSEGSFCTGQVYRVDGGIGVKL